MRPSVEETKAVDSSRPTAEPADLRMATKIRIVLGDDHTLVRQGLRKILEEQPDWEVVAEASDGREAVRQTLALQPDVVVLDIGMPLLNGIEATRQIVRRFAEHQRPHPEHARGRGVHHTGDESGSAGIPSEGLRRHRL